MIPVSKDDPGLVLIHYPGGGYGNFIYLLLSIFIKDTVKTGSTDYVFSSLGDSHKNEKYSTVYRPPYADTDNFLSSYQVDRKFNYDYNCALTEDAYQQFKKGRRALIMVDPSPLVDNHKFLLNYFGQGPFIRVYMDSFVDRLVQFSNLMLKSYSSGKQRPLYKNAILSFESIQGRTDEQIVEELVDTFEKNFNAYGMMYRRPVNNPRIYNLNFNRFQNHDSLRQEIVQIAEFLGSETVNLDQFSQLYSDWIASQPFNHYYSFTKDTVASNDDLTGQALVRYLRNHS